ncbi:MAG TPA: flagellar filament capping protein FliD [bacterium]|mgnify:FL=1|nr:flagellar filament capping protein FliD [bacterium]
MSSGITFSGLFSGLDTDNIITQLMQIERQPITLLQNKQYKLEYEKEALQSVNTSLLALKNAIKSFANGISFSNTFQSSDEAVLTGSAETYASEGSYSVSVTQLAKNMIRATVERPTGWSGAAGTGNFTMASTGEVFSITTVGGESMQQVANMINASTGSLGNSFSDYGRAYVLTNPLNGATKMVWESNKTGTNNIMAPTGYWNVMGYGSAITQAAQNAAFTINGVAYNSYENTVKNVVNGVTLNLNSVGGPATFTIGMDTDAIVDKVKAFVEQFNTTTGLLRNYTTEDPLSDPQTKADLAVGILRGDSDLVSSKSQIRMLTTGYIDNTLSVYKLMSQIGIESEASSGSYVSDKIQLDEDKLRAALADDKEEVSDLLEGWATQLDSYLEKQTKVSVVESFAGSYYRRILNIDTKIDGIDDDILTWEDRISAMEMRLRTQYAQMESLLAALQTQSNYLTQQLSNLSSNNSSSK